MTSKVDTTETSFFKHLLIFLRKYQINIFCFFLLTLLTPFYFYKLGQSSLISWDEAWYAQIARTIAETGDLFHMMWNGNLYYDHPPMGFWLMALSEKLFGYSEFAVRLPSALAGIFTLYFVYLLGKKLFHPMVGLASAFGLSSSLWFLNRSRSGNLDIFLTLFFVMSLYFALKAQTNKKFLYGLAISLSCLFLTKTLVPFTILPALLVIFWGNKNVRLRDFVFPGLVCVILTGVWFGISFFTISNFLSRYLMIGYPGTDMQSSYIDNIKLTKEYIHNGIGKWFWLGLAGLGVGPFLFQKRFLILSLFVLVFVIPFIFSPKGQIWHLIPLHPFFLLSFCGLSFVILQKIIKSKMLVGSLILGAVLVLTYIQLKQSYYQFIQIPAYRSDEEILSKESQKYPGDLYIDGSDFGPTAVYYSQKKVYKVWEGGLPEVFSTVPPFVMITHQWRLDGSHIPTTSYKILKSDRDKILIQKI